MLELEVKVINDKWSVGTFTKIENLVNSNYFE